MISCELLSLGDILGRGTPIYPTLPLTKAKHFENTGRKVWWKLNWCKPNKFFHLSLVSLQDFSFSFLPQFSLSGSLGNFLLPCPGNLSEPSYNKPKPTEWPLNLSFVNKSVSEAKYAKEETSSKTQFQQNSEKSFEGEDVKMWRCVGTHCCLFPSHKKGSSFLPNI